MAVERRRLTSIHRRELFAEEDESGDGGDAVLAGVSRVSDLDEHDLQIVCLVVDPLQLLQNLFALVTVVLI